MSATRFPVPTSPGQGQRNNFDMAIALGSQGVPASFVPTADGTGGTEWTATGAGTPPQHHEEKIVAGPQAVITFAFTYTMGAGKLRVYLNGQQRYASNGDYVETSTSSITFLGSSIPDTDDLVAVDAYN